MKYQVTLSIASITLKTYIVEADSDADAEDLALTAEEDGVRPNDIDCISHDRSIENVEVMEGETQ